MVFRADSCSAELGIAIAVVMMVLLTACQGGRDVTVTRADLDGWGWPVSADSVTLHCLKSGAITADVNEKTYLVDAQYGDKDVPANLPMLDMAREDPGTGILALPFLELARKRCQGS